MPGTERIDELVDRRLLRIWPDKIEEFGDAVVGTVALEKNCPIATFDKTFLDSLGELGVESHDW